MCLSRVSAMLGLAALLTVVPDARAQQPTARVGYVCPAGGQQGTTLIVMVGGRYLDGVSRAFVSGEGVQAKVIEHIRPTTNQGQAGSVRERLKKLMDKKAAAAKDNAAPDTQGKSKASAITKWTPEDEMLLGAMRKRLAIAMRGPPTPATGETVLLQLTVAADATPGHQELRLETPKGLTNPMVFCISQLPEFSKDPAELTNQLLSAPVPRFRNEPTIFKPDPPVEISPPVVVNGQILPGGADRYRFQASKGQRLVISAGARELIPYISDAVPGWFQAALTLYDAKGRELAYADHYLFHPDPILFFEVPEDGQYMVEIRDSLYRGREDFVYRLTVGEIPLVTSIFPLGGQAGAAATVEVMGWNLSATRLTLEGQGKGPGIYPLAARKEKLLSNVVPFAVDTLPEGLEKEPNDQPESAQSITLPMIVNGRIDQPGDRDVFRFEGSAGSEIVAEVYARRLNSPLDSVLRLTDATGRLIAMNDDHEDKGFGLTTHHADSYLRATLPAKGTYYLHLGDVQHKGGPEYGYRLRVGASRPDFDLRVVPASISVRGGGSVPLTVHAIRRDGFAGEIALGLKDAPEGFTLSSETIPADKDEVQLTLKVLLPQQEPVRVNLEGRATIAGQEVSRLAVPAENMMQAFEYRHLVPTKELEVAVSGRMNVRPVAKILSKMPVKIPAGGTARVQISVFPRALFGKAQFELRRPPGGIAIERVSASREGMEIVLQADAAKVKRGLKGSLSVAASTEKPAEPGKPKPPANAPRTTLATLPAIAFEIVEP